MESNQTPHKRRVRYSGTHPKRFEEKYKELNPEKYAADVQHILDKGHTPAGMHISIMVQEILDFLNIQPGQIGLDATLGYGGHTRAMLEKLNGNGHIYALDVDPIESAKTQTRLRSAGFDENILTVRLQNFADIDQVVADTGKKSVQVVSGYIYNGEESLNGSFVTGYSLAINLYENGANYSLASAEKSVTVNGKTMTCLDWFQDHCAQYGFVYTGLEGSQARTLATFRYVGVPHALAMQRLDYVDTKEYSGFLRYYTEQHTVTDFESGITWNIDFYAADKTDALTAIAIPKGAVYTVSGNNVDGFIVAYYIP